MIHRLNGSTKVYGITGFPVSHSLSPIIHNAAFEYTKMNAVYVPFPLQKASASALKALREAGIAGLSVTIPHKSLARKAATECDELSALCDASNTLIPSAKGWKACNTDGPGALQALREHTNIRGRRFLITGYGGSAAAISHALLLEKESPSSLIVTGRSAAKAAAFAEGLSAKHPGSLKKTIIRAASLSELSPEDTDIIIQTTPLGMQGAPQELPLPENFIKNFHIIFDIVYIPSNTPFVKAAKKAGAAVIPGYLMLLYQAVLQFELFTGQKAPVHLMEKELLKALRTGKP